VAVVQLELQGLKVLQEQVVPVIRVLLDLQDQLVAQDLLVQSVLLEEWDQLVQLVQLVLQVQ
jgi:hypothetical protein